MIKYTLGIDEVGRGPLAGPIYFCGYLLPLGETLLKNKTDLKDSKKLTPQSRLEIYNKIKDIGHETVLISHTAKQIDDLGLSKIINLSLEKIILKLIKKGFNLNQVEIKLDGGLKFKEDFVIKIKNKYNMNLFSETLIKGDEKVEAIANASIYAKVKRDKYMSNLNKKIISSSNIDYGFNTNSGYGTSKHLEAISNFGLTQYHRITFCKTVQKSS